MAFSRFFSGLLNHHLQMSEGGSSLTVVQLVQVAHKQILTTPPLPLHYLYYLASFNSKLITTICIHSLA